MFNQKVDGKVLIITLFRAWIAESTLAGFAVHVVDALRCGFLEVDAGRGGLLEVGTSVAACTSNEKVFELHYV